jgi:outer membrane protein OmpA-like peptidoglycan-associated protein
MTDCSCPSCRADRPAVQRRLMPVSGYEFERSTSTRSAASKPCPTQAKTIDCPRQQSGASWILDNFAFDSAAIVEVRHRARIDDFAKRIVGLDRRLGHAPATVTIVGHTDKVGTDAYNLAPARRRAETVARELCRTFERMAPGITRNTILRVSSCGESQPKRTPGASRRVELFLHMAHRPPKRPAPKCRPQFTLPRQIPLDIDDQLRALQSIDYPGKGLMDFLFTLPKTLRFLTPAEQCEAMSMFGSSLDFRRILISDGIGFQDRPFTVVAPSYAGSMVIMHLGDTKAWDKRPRSPWLIHELTHAWQSQHHGTRPDAFMWNSLKCQAMAFADKIHSILPFTDDFASAYDYVPGKEFSAYSAEQIAQQVEDAYSGKGKPTSIVLSTIRSVAMNAPSIDNAGSLATISLERKSAPRLVLH